MMCIHPGKYGACGKCRACRINAQREKKVRICHEAENWRDKCFLTLTYDPEKHDDQNLVKKDLQDFLKRLRRFIEPDKIKYFASGEYGESERHHAHYHLIIFGLNMYDKRVFSEHHHNLARDIWYVKCKAWDKGFVSVAPFNEARANYVAKYVIDKLNGREADKWYHGRTPEFCLTSQGLGLSWLKEHAPLLKEEGFIRQGKKRVPLPRYYQDKLFPKDSYRNIDWRQYKQVKSAESFEELKKRSRTHDKESFEKWQDEVRKATANFMATKLQRKELKSHV